MTLIKKECSRCEGVGCVECAYSGWLLAEVEAENKISEKHTDSLKQISAEDDLK